MALIWLLGINGHEALDSLDFFFSLGVFTHGLMLSFRNVILVKQSRNECEQRLQHFHDVNGLAGYLCQIKQPNIPQDPRQIAENGTSD